MTGKNNWSTNMTSQSQKINKGKWIEIRTDVVKRTGRTPGCPRVMCTQFEITPNNDNNCKVRASMTTKFHEILCGNSYCQRNLINEIYSFYFLLIYFVYLYIYLCMNCYLYLLIFKLFIVSVHELLYRYCFKVYFLVCYLLSPCMYLLRYPLFILLFFTSALFL
jgi:hypothetical protein